MKELNLTQRKIALVDDEDYEKVRYFRWYAYYDPAMRSFIPQRNITEEDGTRRTIYLHRFVMNAPKGSVVDHIDHDTLNCQKSNLRICTHAQNMLNRRVYKNNKTGFKGVEWRPEKNKFVARIRADNKKIHLGYFTDKVEAAKAYNTAAIKYHGEFANLNHV